MLKNKNLLAVIAITLWLFFSLFPWQAWFQSFAILRFSIGLLVYLIPGVLAFLYITDDKNISPRVLLGGFALTILVTGLLGLFARLFHLNFIFIRWGFALWGIAALILFLLQKDKITFQFEKFTWWEVLLFLFAAGSVIYFAAITSLPLIHDDAFTYNVLIYYYQHAPVLDFNFPDSLNRLEIPRFWIAYWPLVEAMISGLSYVDGLIVAGAYLPPVLACFSFIGIYALGRTLGLPRAVAFAAILAQGFSLMRLSRPNQPGDLFFQRITEDKVVAAFVISLILILFAVEYFEKPDRRKLIIVGIAALAMAFTHPVQFGMTCMIIGVYGLPLLFKKDFRWKYFSLIGVLAAVVVIPFFFRFGGGEYSQSLSFTLADVAANNEFERFGIRRVEIIEGTPFYGISPYLTPGLPYEISLVAVIVSLFFFWRHKSARYVLAAFLVLGVSMIPYTGWIVGMFTTPFQLWRLTWLMPFGLAFAFLGWVGFEIIQKIRLFQQRISWIQPLYYLSFILVLVASIVYVHPWTMGNIERRNLDVIDFYSNYLSTAKLMNEMDVNKPVIVGGPDTTTNSIIPSLTLNYMPLVFRVESGGEQTKLWKSLIGDDIPPQERLARLQENNVEYLLIKGEPGWLLELLDNYPNNISRIFRDQRFSLYKLNP
ncbi:MAG: hypothetical protein H7Y59_05450 [Anaerolineales bacterium]|nr:hypothetical protein [Anaerolineales bacterium]